MKSTLTVNVNPKILKLLCFLCISKMYWFGGWHLQLPSLTKLLANQAITHLWTSTIQRKLRRTLACLINKLINSNFPKKKKSCLKNKMNHEWHNLEINMAKLAMKQKPFLMSFRMYHSSSLFNCLSEQSSYQETINPL